MNVNILENDEHFSSTEKVEYEKHLKEVIHGSSIIWVPRKYWTEEILLATVSYDGMNIECIPREYRTQKIILEAVDCNCDSFKFIPQEDRTEELMIEALKINEYVMPYIPQEFRTEEMMKYSNILDEYNSCDEVDSLIAEDEEHLKEHYAHEAWLYKLNGLPYDEDAALQYFSN